MERHLKEVVERGRRIIFPQTRGRARWDLAVVVAGLALVISSDGIKTPFLEVSTSCDSSRRAVVQVKGRVLVSNSGTLALVIERDGINSYRMLDESPSGLTRWDFAKVYRGEAVPARQYTDDKRVSSFRWSEGERLAFRIYKAELNSKGRISFVEEVARKGFRTPVCFAKQ